MAVELRNRLQVSTGHALPTTLAFDYPTVTALARFRGRRGARARSGRVGSRERARTTTAVFADAVRGLSDEEASRLLLEELARGQDGRREVIDGG